MTQQQIDRQRLFAQLCDALDKVRYGEVLIKVEDHRAVWMELHEKIRMVAGEHAG